MVGDGAAFEIERRVVCGGGGVFEAEVGVVDEEEAAGFELGIETGDLLLKQSEGEALVHDRRGVGAVLAALEDGHGEDGVKVGEGGELATAGVEEADAGVAVGSATLPETPVVDVGPDDGGVGEIFDQGEGLLAGGAAEGEDGGGRCVPEVGGTCGEEFGVAIWLGVGGALDVGVEIVEAGEVLPADAWAEQEAADVSEWTHDTCERLVK